MERDPEVLRVFKALFRTPNDFAILFVRLGLGASLLPHGLEKLGLFAEDSPGILASAKEAAPGLVAMAGISGIPDWVGYLAIAAEVLGATLLILGFLGRFQALVIGALLAVAAYSQLGGFETDAVLRWWRDFYEAPTYGSYHILGVFAALAILIRGSGALSLDRAFGWKTDTD